MEIEKETYFSKTGEKYILCEDNDKTYLKIYDEEAKMTVRLFFNKRNNDIENLANFTLDIIEQEME